MGKRHSKQEIEQIKTLISEGLTKREIASKLQRPEWNQKHQIPTRNKAQELSNTT